MEKFASYFARPPGSPMHTIAVWKYFCSNSPSTVHGTQVVDLNVHHTYAVSIHSKIDWIITGGMLVSRRWVNKWTQLFHIRGSWLRKSPGSLGSAILFHSSATAYLFSLFSNTFRGRWVNKWTQPFLTIGFGCGSQGSLNTCSLIFNCMWGCNSDVKGND